MPKTKIRIYSHYPFTGAGAGHETLAEAMLRFSKAVQAVKADMKTLSDNKEETLTVLLAPEWNFKKRGGFFSYSDAMGAIGALQDLSRGSEILMFPGSILWAMPGRNKIGQTRDFSFKKFKFVEKDLYQEHSVVYNTLPILQDGSVVHMVHKMFDAFDTNIRNQRAGTEMFAFDPNEFRADSFWQQWKDRIRNVSATGASVPDLSANIFTCGDLRFGVEICADHTGRRLKQLRPSPPIDVQILISCGMTFQQSCMAVRSGGIAASCDGSANEDSPALSSAFVMPAGGTEFPRSGAGTRHPVASVGRTVRFELMELSQPARSDRRG